MVVGFNHNFTYKGVIYHIQTEDSGRKSPTIVTLLYHGGTILASRKTSYADIAKVDNLEQVVEELMKEQHKGMLRGLKNGEFDEVIARFEKGGLIAPLEAPTLTAPARPSPPPAPAPAPVTSSPEPVAAASLPPRPVPPAAPVAPVAGPAPPAASAAAPAAESQAPPTPQAKKPGPAEASLDEIILSYLMGEDK